MRVVNRNAVVVMPRQPFVDWIRRVSPVATVTLDEIRDDYSCYLIPELLSRREQKEYLEQNFTAIFRQELTAWSADSASWPKSMTFRLFLEFFEVNFHSVVQDLVDDPLWRP
ncbi:MAG: hypothetical protein AB7O52_03805 [Planctomycetota bacterium]